MAKKRDQAQNRWLKRQQKEKLRRKIEFMEMERTFLRGRKHGVLFLNHFLRSE